MSRYDNDADFKKQNIDFKYHRSKHNAIFIFTIKIETSIA